MTENERDLYPTPSNPDDVPTPTSVRVPNVGAHAVSGLDGTVLGSAGEGTDNAVAAERTDDVAEHPTQADPEPDDGDPASTTNLSSLEDGGEGEPVEHPAQEPEGTDDPGPSYDVPQGLDSEGVYAWVVGTGDDDEATVQLRADRALAAEQAKPEGEQDADLIALLSPPEDTPVEKQSGTDPDPDPVIDTTPPGEGTVGVVTEAPAEVGTATTGEPMHAGEHVDVTAPADQQGAAPTP